MTPAEVLLKAADVIERQGWIQGSYRDASGRCCAVGAIHAAGTVLDERDVAAIDGATAILFHALGGDCGIPAWNDEPGRTQAEVVAALRSAAGVTS